MFNVLPTVVLIAAYFASWLFLRSRILDLVFLSSVGAPTFAWVVTSAVLPLSRRFRQRVHRMTYGRRAISIIMMMLLSVLAIPFLVALSISFLVGNLVYILVTPFALIVLASASVLATSKRLRSIVFSIGGVLLMSGMTAQFVATF